MLQKLNACEFLQSLIALEREAERLFAEHGPSTSADDNQFKQTSLNKLRWNIRELQRLLSFVGRAPPQSVRNWKSRLGSLQSACTSTTAGSILPYIDSSTTQECGDNQTRLVTAKGGQSIADKHEAQGSPFYNILNDTKMLLAPLTEPSNSTLTKLRMRVIEKRDDKGDGKGVAVVRDRIRDHMATLVHDMKSTALSYRDVIFCDNKILEETSANQERSLLSTNQAKQGADALVSDRFFGQFIVEAAIVIISILLFIATASFIFMTKAVA